METANTYKKILDNLRTSLGLKEEVELNTEITEELRKEGEYREMVRNVSKISRLL